MAIFFNQAFVLEMDKMEQTILDARKCPKFFLRQTMNLIDIKSVLNQPMYSGIVPVQKTWNSAREHS
jgi:hypothetical protein